MSVSLDKRQDRKELRIRPGAVTPRVSEAESLSEHLPHPVQDTTELYSEIVSMR
jgi:hypothetical protein